MTVRPLSHPRLDKGLRASEDSSAAGPKRRPFMGYDMDNTVQSSPLQVREGEDGDLGESLKRLDYGRSRQGSLYLGGELMVLVPELGGGHIDAFEPTRTFEAFDLGEPYVYPARKSPRDIFFGDR